VGLAQFSADGADWSRFRGPNGSGISSDPAPAPTTWSGAANLKWKVALPGPGSSSPIVVGERVFVTSWSGYGLSRENPGDQAQLRRHLTCLDRETGATIWDKSVEPVLPEDEYGGMFAEHGYASHSPVSDGEHVYVFFGKSGALAFDLDGKLLWQRGVGTESDPHGWGSASSPILYKNLLIVPATAESEALVALDKATGEEVWRQEATGFNGVWGTPVLVELADGEADLAMAVSGEMWGFDPATGKLRWYCKSPVPSSFSSSAIAHEGIVYAMESGPGGGGGIAVRAGGRGDVTDTHVEWTGSQANRIGTPLLVGGRIYTFSRGLANCFDAGDGGPVYRGRLKSSGAAPAGGGRGGFGGQDYSSPVAADGKIYFTSRGGDVYVLEEGEKFRQLAVNRVTDEAEDFSASPAISNGEIFIRSSKYLYCIAQLAEGELQQQVDAANRVDATTQEASEPEEEPQRQRGGFGGGGFGGGGGGQFDPASIFDRRDTNGDGKLEGQELEGPFADRYQQIDTDKDGAISKAEFTGGIGQLFRGGGGGRGGRGGRGGGFGGDARQGRPDRPARPELE
jgi:outer membrane protein assembly factor BamB